MKKILITFVLLIGIVFTKVSNAQDLRFGVKAGVNMSTMSFDEVYDNAKMKVGFQLGCLSEYSINSKLATEVDFLFALQGFKASATGTGYERNVTHNAFYVNVPLMLKWYIVDNVSVAFGPQVGLVVSAKNKMTEKFTGESSKTTKTSVKDRYAAADFGLCIAADYYVTENIFVGAGFNLGLTNLYKGDGYNIDSKNRVITLNVGYSF